MIVLERAALLDPTSNFTWHIEWREERGFQFVEFKKPQLCTRALTFAQKSNSNFLFFNIEIQIYLNISYLYFDHQMSSVRPVEVSNFSSICSDHQRAVYQSMLIDCVHAAGGRYAIPQCSGTHEIVKV